MSESIIRTDWYEQVYLAPECRERFVTQQLVPVLESLSIYMAGLAQLEVEYFVERKGAHYHTLLFSMDGEGFLTLPNENRAIPPATLTILPAGQPFRFELSDKLNKWQIAWVLLRPESSWQSVNRRSADVIACDYVESVWSLLTLLYSTPSLSGRYHVWANDLAECIRLSLQVDQLYTSAQQRVANMFSEIADQLHQSWSVGEIARRSFLSEAQLNRICHQLYERSAHQQVTWLKMEKAKELLRYSHWNLSIIATHLGYQDAYIFSKRFRQSVGSSPGVYRRGAE